MKYTDEQRIAKIIEYTDKMLNYVKQTGLTREIVIENGQCAGL